MGTYLATLLLKYINLHRFESLVPEHIVVTMEVSFKSRRLDMSLRVSKLKPYSVGFFAYGTIMWKGDVSEYEFNQPLLYSSSFLHKYNINHGCYSDF